MRIRTKLVAAFLLIPLLGGATAYFAFENIRQVEDSFNVLHFQVVPTVSALKDAKVATLSIAASVREIAGEQDSDTMAAQRGLVEKDELAFEDAMERYSALTSVYFPGQSSFEEITGDWEQFEASADAVIAAAEGGAELAPLRENFSESEQELLDSLDGAIELAEGNVAEEEVTFASSLNNAVYLTVAVLAISIAITLTIVVLILRSISEPLASLRDVTHEVAKGNFDTTVDTNRNDEIGELAADFEKMKQELKEKDRLKEEFINIAAHELRTPVLPIVLTAEELADEIDAGNSSKVEVILRNAKRINKLTNDILDVSRIESNSFKIRKSATDIVELARTVISDSGAGMPSGRGVGFALHPTLSEEKRKVMIDKEKIQQVLVNLVNNAVDFTESGTITIRIDEGHENTVAIKVVDTGKGIDESIQGKLFQKFVTKSNKAKGTGLGLFICKAIVEAHGGKITAENNETGGATFSFTLPVA